MLCSQLVKQRRRGSERTDGTGSAGWGGGRRQAPGWDECWASEFPSLPFLCGNAPPATMNQPWMTSQSKCLCVPYLCQNISVSSQSMWEAYAITSALRGSWRSNANFRVFFLNYKRNTWSQYKIWKISENIRIPNILNPRITSVHILVRFSPEWWFNMLASLCIRIIFYLTLFILTTYIIGKLLHVHSSA